MSSGRKGSNSERELVKKFIEIGWQALRIAGSGKLNLAPDILAGSPGKLLIIECKASGKPAIYVHPDEVTNTLDYARKFGGDPWYGFRFDRKEWKFIKAHDMVGKKKAINGEGICFEELTGVIASKMILEVEDKKDESSQ